MEKLNFEGLDAEIFFEQPWFADFMEVYADVLNDRIRHPISQLENIRSIDSDTDPYVVLQTLKQIGFDLPSDFVRHNLSRLGSSISQLVLYAERSGANDYAHTMSFIYGRSIDSTGLYTNDYKNFYSQAYGTLQVDGGEWYKTTHIELGMQLLSSDYRLLLPRDKTIKDRFFDAFYEFAPWNVVVERFYFNIDVKASLYISGRIVKQPKHYHEVGVGALQITDLKIVGPVEVYEASSQEFELLAVMSNEDKSFSQTVPVNGSWSSNKTGLVDFTGDTATFGGVSLDTDVVLYAEFEGRSVSHNLKVRNDASYIRVIEIIGPDELRSNESGKYEVRATTIHGTENVEVPITTASMYGQVIGNELTVHQIDADSAIELCASLTLPNGLVLNAVKRVTAIYVDPEVHLVDLEIVGPSEFYENENKEYTAIAHFSDGSQRGIIGLWDSGCGSVYITPDGQMTSGTTESELNLTFTVTYQHKQVIKTAEKQVTFKRFLLAIVHTEILGPNTVIELSDNRYAVAARFNDGSTGYVNAEWLTDKFTINDEGTLRVGSVGNTPINLTLRARVDGRDAIKQVVAINTPVTLDNVLVLGPDNLKEGSVGKYTAYAHYSNGRDVEITPIWSIIGNHDWVKIDQDGLLSFSEPKLGIVELQASYKLSGKTFNQTKTLVLIPKTRIIQGLLISGPSTVNEEERVVLTATAVYSDGQTETVSPSWSVTSADPLNDPEAMADIVSPGVLQGRGVDAPTKVIAIARYYKEIAEFELTVNPRVRRSPDVPKTHRIVGPASFYAANQRGSYSQMIKFNDCPSELAVSSTWTIDVEPEIATIDSAGFVWSVNGKSAVVVVTAVYECGSYTITDTLLVNIIGQEDTLKSMNIIGPDAMIENQTVLFQAELFRIGEVETPGKGHIVQPKEWSIVAPDGRVTVNGNGEVLVIDAGTSFKFILKAVYVEGYETLTATKEVTVIRNAVPIFGIGPVGVRNDPEVGTYLNQSLPTLASNQRFTLTASANQYMYFCHPASLGIAKFVDVGSDLEGGWDGASWPDNGEVGDLYGPISITRLDSQGKLSNWYLYRTDFDGIGTYTYEVSFGN